MEHKSGNISETRKARGKVTMGAYTELTNVPAPCGLLLYCIAIISGTGKATNFKFGRNIHRVHPNNTGKVLG